MMEVIIAEKHGFCPGVKNAIKLAKETLAKQGKVYSLGPIIHNDQVVSELAQAGLKTVNSIENISDGTVLIRSHGATAEQLDKIRQKGLKIVDATCVLVKRLQKISIKLNKDGYKVVMIGDKEHPEVQAIVGSTENIIVAASQADLETLGPNEKLGIICQTTQSRDYFAQMVANIVKKGFSELKIINTLCKEAVQRQASAVELCKKVDVMFVLGGHDSANTKKLAELCKKHNKQTFHLQNIKELDKNTVYGKRIAGITAGASTPETVVSEFVGVLRGLDSSEGGD
jgi:(E)-4-hydroxy-3-methyl-but-2-enyl pyrophosphate reductase